MRLVAKQKLALAALLWLVTTAASASDFNSIIANLVFVPAHLLFGTVALVLLIGGAPPRTGRTAGVLLTPMTLVNSLFVWSMGRPKSIAMEWQFDPGSVVIGALVLSAPVLLSTALVARYWRERAA